MTGVLRYTRTDELEPVSITWYQPNGTLYNFTSGWTFRARIGTGSGFLVEKTTGFTGAATAPNLSINFTTGELDGVPSGTYHLDVQATFTATAQTITRTWVFQVLAGVGTDTLPQSPISLSVLGDLSVGGEIFVGGLPLPELAAADPAEVGLVTAGGVTTLTLLDLVSRLMFPNRSGRYYTNSSDAATTVQTMTQNTLTYFPVPLSAGTVDRVGGEVTTAVASGVLRMGIYNDDDGIPSTLLAEASGTGNASTTGVKDLTISAVIPRNGRYWLAAVIQGAAGIQLRANDRGTILPVPVGTAAPTSTGGFHCLLDTGTISGALPGTATLNVTANANGARLWWRYV